MIESHFIYDEREEMVIKQWEKLHNIKSKYAGGEIFNPFWSNEIDKDNASIYSWSVLKTT